MASDIPLCVDLDGTLIKCDSLVESFAKSLKTSPIKSILALKQLFVSKASFKNAISLIDSVDASSLPYNREVIEYLETEKSTRSLVLVTGANEEIANSVSRHLGLFDMVIASDSHTNLVGTAKRDRLDSTFGNKQYDYIGNEETDIPVWQSARKSLVVAPKGEFLTRVKSKFKPDKVFLTKPPTISTWLKFARVHQWSKNLLILVPLILDHRYAKLEDLATIGLSFVAFSLLASLTYMINDILDVEADRLNSTKSLRALASGHIQLQQAIIAIACLAVLVIGICLFLPVNFVVSLGAYLILTLLYSFVLKKIVMLDVCLLAVLHTVRIIAGTLAIQAAWSFWLLAFSMFFFLSLAIAKRVSELENVKKENKSNPIARGYTTSDIPILVSAGTTAGYTSILVIALYINSDKVAQMYRIPEILWLMCPLLLYWIGRLWIVTSRGQMHEDPIVFALRDKTSLGIFAAIGLVFAAAVLAT